MKKRFPSSIAKRAAGYGRRAALLLALSGLAAAAYAQPTFSPAVGYGTAGNSQGIATADFNGDGRPDLATANSADNTVTVLLAAGAAGTFAAPVTYATNGGGGNFVVTIGAGDVNGDGRPDLVTINQTPGTVAVFLNSAATPGTFLPAVTYASGGTTSRGVALGDVNGDDRLDIVTTSLSNNSVGVLLNSAVTPGTFAAAVTYPCGGIFPDEVVVGDLNGDGRPDIATVNRNSGTVSVLLNVAATPGTFGGAATYPSGGTLPSGIALGDLDGDGRPDIAVANSGSNQIGVLLNSTATPGTFPTTSAYSSVNSGPTGVAIGDLDDDGRPEIVSQQFSNNGGGTTITVLVNSAATPGTFPAAGTTYASGGNGPIHAVVRDLNGDGRADIAATNLVSQNVGVLLNTTTFSAPTLTSLSPTSGAVGASVTLTGTNLNSAISVSFNGTNAPGFVVNSATSITVNVPTGATSGNVTVTTAGGTSNGVAFEVVRDLVVMDGQEVYANGSYRNVTVQSGGSLYLDGDLSVTGALLVQDGGTLGTETHTVSGAGSFALEGSARFFISNAGGITPSPVLSGDIQLTGPRTYSVAASYIYVGRTAQATGAGLPAEVRELQSGNDNDVTLTNPVGIRRVLSVYGNGHLRFADGAVTLLSDATGTASVNYGFSSYPGVFTVQRYVSGDLTAGPAYRHLGAPVQDAAVSQLSNGSGFAPVVNNAYNSAVAARRVQPFPTVFGYDETRLRPAANGGSRATDFASAFDKGFFSPAALSEVLEPGQGYAVHLSANRTLTFTGPLSTADITVPLTRTNDEASAGWNLVGNPFAASFDLRDLANTPNVDNAKYVFEATGPYVGQYRVFLPGQGEGPGIGEPLVALGQAFFTRVSEAGTPASLRLSPFATSVGDNTVFHRTAPETRPLLALTLSNAAGTLRDLTTLYQDAAATPGLDSRYDAVKLSNVTGLNLSQQAAGQQLAINGLPAFTAATVVPLTVQVPAAGTYALQVARLLNLPAGTTATLVDHATGTSRDLATLPAAGYTFATTKGEVLTGRFVLNLRSAVALATTTASLNAASLGLAPNPAHGRTTVLVPAVAGATRATLTLSDALGRAVRTVSAALPAAGLRQELNLEGLAPGVYLLQVQAGTERASRRLLVN